MDSTRTNAPDVGLRDTDRYQAALAFLFDRINYERVMRMPYSKRDLNLSRMQRLLELLDNPHRSLNLIHIAGTKGKGSTAALLSSVFAADGKRCGSYTSPHLHHIEERFQVNGTDCTPTMLMEILEEVRPSVQSMDKHYADGGPTYFEIATAVAFLFFQRRGVDVAVLEVGLGGRLDSTNVCEPLVSVITSISFDHMKQLGNTLAQIAGEKAGIIKPGVPVVCGAIDPEPRQVIHAKARELGASVIQLGEDTDYSNYRVSSPPTRGGLADFELSGRLAAASFSAVEFGLMGQHQAANAAVALAALFSLPAKLWPSELAIRQGFRSASCIARMECISEDPVTVVDAAHNVASAEALVRALNEGFPDRRRHLLLGTTEGKDVAGMLRILLPAFESVVCTQYQDNPRGYQAGRLGDLARSLASELQTPCVDQIEALPSPAMAWKAIRCRSDSTDLVCVTGSFFIAAEVRQLILQEQSRRGTKPSVRPD